MKVGIINGGPAYYRMFRDRGWETTQSLGDADLIQFCGGADVSPAMYGEACHPQTFNDEVRDNKEHALYSRAVAEGIPVTGICRGGQFLNVMNGGRMYQHVNHHAIGGTHPAVDVATGQFVQVSSTHHQMMRPASDAQLVAVAKRSSFYENVEGEEEAWAVVNRETTDQDEDVEVVFYKDTRALCFQPHPEHLGVDDCCDYYFELLARYLDLEV